MTASSGRVERAADLILRLVEDPDYRALFRRRPAEAVRPYGLDDVAAEFDGSGRGMQTLDGRESRSSLAGALAAAALEGTELLELVRDARHLGGGDGGS
jgi:hypothetical protein